MQRPLWHNSIDAGQPDGSGVSSCVLRRVCWHLTVFFLLGQIFDWCVVVRFACRNLHLNSNLLSGSIPPTLATLTSLA
jgi:hypothetical protein